MHKMKQKFSIRKLHIGAFSILVGVGLYFGAANIQAEEVDEPTIEESSTDEIVEEQHVEETAVEVQSVESTSTDETQEVEATTSTSEIDSGNATSFPTSTYNTLVSSTADKYVFNESDTTRFFRGIKVTGAEEVTYTLTNATTQQSYTGILSAANNYSAAVEFGYTGGMWEFTYVIPDGYEQSTPVTKRYGRFATVTTVTLTKIKENVEEETKGVTKTIQANVPSAYAGAQDIILKLSNGDTVTLTAANGYSIEYTNNEPTPAGGYDFNIQEIVSYDSEVLLYTEPSYTDSTKSTIFIRFAMPSTTFTKASDAYKEEMSTDLAYWFSAEGITLENYDLYTDGVSSNFNASVIRAVADSGVLPQSITLSVYQRNGAYFTDITLNEDNDYTVVLMYQYDWVDYVKIGNYNVYVTSVDRYSDSEENSDTATDFLEGSNTSSHPLSDLETENELGSNVIEVIVAPITKGGKNVFGTVTLLIYEGEEPEEPKEPEEPEKPEVPETPEEPEVPEIPETPEEPDGAKGEDDEPETPTETKVVKKETVVQQGVQTSVDTSLFGFSSTFLTSLSAFAIALKRRNPKD